MAEVAGAAAAAAPTAGAQNHGHQTPHVKFDTTTTNATSSKTVPRSDFRAANESAFGRDTNSAAAASAPPPRNVNPPPRNNVNTNKTSPTASTPNDSPASEKGGRPTMKYEYMFEEGKAPTRQFDALLRAIAHHIILKIGDPNDTHLTPTKLAAYYKAVGGNYDPIFVDCDHETISLLWQKTGCQHTLQPTSDAYAPPSIPALTPTGFSRWSSVEILLEPAEHVPYLQYCVKNWNLRNLHTGEVFPKELPKEVFPSKTDQQVDLWHKECAQTLRNEAENSEKEKERGRAKGHAAHFAHAGAPNSRPGSKGSKGPGPGRARFTEPEYTGGQPFTRSHSTRNGKFPSDRGNGKNSPTDRLRRESPEDMGRRKSFSDYPSPPVTEHIHHSYPPKSETFPKRPGTTRRHSHPRRYSVSSSPSEDETPSSGNNHTRTSKRRGSPQPPPPTIRRNAAPPAPIPQANTSRHREGRDGNLRPEDRRAQGQPSPRGGSLREKLTEKVANMLPNGIVGDGTRPESRESRPRYDSRGNSYVNDHVRSRKSRDFHGNSSRLSRSHSDLDSDHSDMESADEENLRRRQRIDNATREARYRQAARREQRDREFEGVNSLGVGGSGGNEDGWDSGGRRDRYLRRPDVQRRTSSHADIDRRERMERAEWDWERERRSKENRERYEGTGYERERGMRE